MHEQTIGVVTTTKKTFEMIAPRFEEAGLAAHWQAPYPVDATFDAFFLLTPLFVQRTYVATASFWKNYLARHQPASKLLTMGFQAIRHPNHIDMLNWPEDLAATLQQAAIASTPWSPIPEGGIDIRKRFFRFFEGHGDESLTDVLHNILRVLIMVHDEIDQHQESFSVVFDQLISPSRIEQKWQLLLSRWVNYIPFFEGLPFYPTFAKLDRLLQQIAPFFTDGCRNEQLLRQLQCVNHLKTIKSELELIARQYVN
jgi:hypothetical protein